MTFVEQLKAHILQAVKARDDFRRNILKVALGEIQIAEARANKPLADDAAQKLVRKIITNNQEVMTKVALMKKTPDEIFEMQENKIPLNLDIEENKQLLKENETLEGILPKLWDKFMIQSVIASIDGICTAPENKAMGLAMGALKKVGASVDGNLVKETLLAYRATHGQETA